VSAVAGRSLQTWRLRVTRTVEQEVLIVTVTGRLGTRSSGELIEVLVDAIRQGHRRILCDLEGVDYASSAGLLALDAVSGRMHVAGGELVLCGLSDPVRLVLDLAGLLPHFAVEPSRNAALARLRRAPAHRDP
jgi:stage II sporulation protein AA (anti-sigma F factor antagonist)